MRQNEYLWSKGLKRKVLSYDSAPIFIFCYFFYLCTKTRLHVYGRIELWSCKKIGKQVKKKDKMKRKKKV